MVFSKLYKNTDMRIIKNTNSNNRNPLDDAVIDKIAKEMLNVEAAELLFDDGKPVYDVMTKSTDLYPNFDHNGINYGLKTIRGKIYLTLNVPIEEFIIKLDEKVKYLEEQYNKHVEESIGTPRQQHLSGYQTVNNSQHTIIKAKNSLKLSLNPLDHGKTKNINRIIAMSGTQSSGKQIPEDNIHCRYRWDVEYIFCYDFRIHTDNVDLSISSNISSVLYDYDELFKFNHNDITFEIKFDNIRAIDNFNCKNKTKRELKQIIEKQSQITLTNWSTITLFSINLNIRDLITNRKLDKHIRQYMEKSICQRKYRNVDIFKLRQVTDNDQLQKLLEDVTHVTYDVFEQNLTWIDDKEMYEQINQEDTDNINAVLEGCDIQLDLTQSKPRNDVCMCCRFLLFDDIYILYSNTRNDNIVSYVCAYCMHFSNKKLEGKCKYVIEYKYPRTKYELIEKHPQIQEDVKQLMIDIENNKDSIVTSYYRYHGYPNSDWLKYSGNMTNLMLTVDNYALVTDLYNFMYSDKAINCNKEIYRIEIVE